MPAEMSSDESIAALAAMVRRRMTSIVAPTVTPVAETTAVEAHIFYVTNK